MTESEDAYLDLVWTLTRQPLRMDRTGVGTRSMFATSLEFDLSEGFPLLTSKRVPFKSMATELLWFLQGKTDKAWLQERNCTIWDEWSGKYIGDTEDTPDHIGPGYGWQWRKFGAAYNPLAPTGWHRHTEGVDQIANVIDSLRDDPMSRRHVVSAWNPSALDEMALPPCHMQFQFYVDQGTLSCQMYQRSADIFLGVPFNIASYSLLTYIIAKEVGLTPGTFTWVGGDTHLYENHMEQAEELTSRTPRPYPTLELKEAPRQPGDILPNYTVDDFVLSGYNPHAAIKAPVAV